MTAIVPYIAALMLALALVSGGLAFWRTQQLEAERKDNAVLSSNFAACETGQDKLRDAVDLLESINRETEEKAKAEIRRQEQAAIEAELALSELAGELTMLQGKLAEDDNYVRWSDNVTPPQVAQTLQ